MRAVCASALTLALTLTLSHAGSGMGEGSLPSIVFGRAQLTNTPARRRCAGEGTGNSTSRELLAA